MNASLPEQADVVVVGGGIVGCSVFYHLVKAGVSNVVLLERFKIASGTTFHSAALTPPLAPTRAETELARYSCALYAELESETGQSTGWRKCGHLNLASSKNRLEALKHFLSSLHARGVNGDLIGPAEVQDRCPLLNVTDVEAAIWMPDAGRVDPTDVCSALLKGGRQHGGTVFEDTRVVGCIIKDKKIRGVRTDSGDICCDIVVNCAGLWGRNLGEMAGVSIPLFPCHHFYILTDTVEGAHRDLPALRDADAHLYLREDVGGVLVGCFEPNPKPLPFESLPDAPFILLEEDWDHFEPMLEGAINRVPALLSAGSRQFVNGPESFTMDHHPLLGQAPEVDGFYVACGMNSFGITMAGGIGWVMADLVTKGSTDLDVSSMDIRRFTRNQNNLRSLSRRIPEVLANHHALPWPGRDYETVRNVRRSPFHSLIKRYGAFFSERGGWERPVWFAGEGKNPLFDATFGRPAWFNQWAAEHLATRNSVAIFDGSPLSKILVQGRDALPFLNRIMSRDVAMPVNTARYCLMLNDRGGIESDPMVSRLDVDRFLITTGSGQGCRDVDWLKRHLNNAEAVTVIDVTSGYATLMVAGPKSRQFLSAFSCHDLDDEAFPCNAAREIDIGYATAIALRFSYTGELGFELHIAPDSALSVLELLLLEESGVDVTLGGLAALNSLRLERGFRSWGHDICPSDAPYASGLGISVQLDKACNFIGKTAALNEHESPLKRRLLSFVFEDETAFPHGEEAIYRNGDLCGFLTSASFGHFLGVPIGMGWVQKGDMSDESIASDTFHVELATRLYRVIPHPYSLYRANQG